MYLWCFAFYARYFDFYACYIASSLTSITWLITCHASFLVNGTAYRHRVVLLWVPSRHLMHALAPPLVDASSGGNVGGGKAVVEKRWKTEDLKSSRMATHGVEEPELEDNEDGEEKF